MPANLTNTLNDPLFDRDIISLFRINHFNKIVSDLDFWTNVPESLNYTKNISVQRLTILHVPLIIWKLLRLLNPLNYLQRAEIRYSTHVDFINVG